MSDTNNTPVESKSDATNTETDKSTQLNDKDGSKPPLNNITTEDVLDDQTISAIDPERPLEIEKIAESLFLARSFKEDKTVEYTVDMDNTPVCECDGFYYHEKCRHIRRIQIITGNHKLPYIAQYLDIEFDPNIGEHIEPQIEYKKGREIDE